MINEYNIIDNTSSPGPLGFIGLGLSASLLGLQGMGFFSDNLVIISMAIFLGGFSQLIAGIQFWKKGDLFSSTAFTSFGLYWLSYAYILIAPFGIEIASSKSIAWYLIFWSLYACGMCIGTLKIKGVAIKLLFLLLTLTFLLTGLSNLGIQLSVLPALVTLSLGLVSMYISIASILNSLGYNLQL